MADTQPAPTQQAASAPRGRGGRGRGRGRGRGARPPRADQGAAPHADGAESTPREPREVKFEPKALFVAGFPPGTEAQEVGTYFSTYGDVEHVRLSARGVGRVVFQNEEAIPKSLALNGSDYKGAKLRVEQHRQRFNRFGRGRGRGRGRGGRAPAQRSHEEGDATAAPHQAGQPKPQRAPRKPREPAAPAADAAPVEPKPVDPTRVFLGRLPYSLEDAELNDIFSPLGSKSIERSRNHLFAIVTFGTAEQAAHVVANKPTLKSGRTIRVEAENPNIKATRTNRPRVRRVRKPVDPSQLDNKRVFVGYIPEGATAESVSHAFTGVTSVDLRGKYAYVHFDSDANANAAIAKNNTPVFGGETASKIEVATRPPRAPKPAPTATAPQ